MRETFKHFYLPSLEKIDNIWETGIISLDANVLLNLYRYSTETRKELLEVISDHSDRIWITYQAGREYHRNRISVILEMQSNYAKVIHELDRGFEKFRESLNIITKHPDIQKDTIINQIETIFNQVKNEIQEKEENHPDLPT